MSVHEWPTSGSAINELAAVLYWNLQRVDPDDGPSWEELSEIERAMYVKCVKAVLREDRLIAQAIS
jgi:hypothetical protein